MAARPVDRPQSCTADTAAHVLIVDPDLVRSREAEQAITLAKAVPVSCGPDALRHSCAAAIVGLDTAAMDTAEVREDIRKLRSRGIPVLPHGPGASRWTLGDRARVLVVTGRLPFDSAADGFRQALAAAVAEVLEVVYHAREERRQVLDVMDRFGVVGRSEQLIAVFRRVLRVSALSDVPAVVAGPTGAGKELVARGLHALDPKRAAGPFVPVNCAAISPHIAESELFGHRRGAFTGADRDRPGLFRAADCGVLFLDEIGELDLPIQGKILRTLQDGRVLGVGSDHEAPISVRVIAATNRDLGVMVGDGRFRADLYHRLTAISIRVPPLVERPDDIDPLVTHFIERHGGCAPFQVAGADPDFIDALLRSGLPGNVRQIENLVRRALVERDRPGRLGLDDLPAEMWSDLADADHATEPRAMPPAEGCDRTLEETVAAARSSADWNLARTLQACEGLMVAAALEKSDGSQTRAARLLGITPRSVYNKVKRHHLSDRRRPA
jgi:two-component system, NtrC family, response regulator HydG